MNRAEFIQEWRYELDGWLLDACMEGRKGAELSLWLRVMRAKVEAKLGAIYDSMNPPVLQAQPEPSKNGTHPKRIAT